MEDIFILEDNTIDRRRMEGQIPEELTYVLAKDGREFEDYLANDGRARLYFLDDMVPDSSGNAGFHFIKHCTHLTELRPDAKVFYTGSVPGSREEAYCGEHDIQIVQKSEISDIIRGEFEKLKT